ncbi:MAG: hypothetical protein P3B98_05130 [Gemmatimonadota bacterium]|nr:hypothetical protein [Gemmatimonadota bacterium]
MFSLIARFLVLRPLLGVAVLGVPVLALVAIGLATVVALKLFFFVVLPIGLVIWLVRNVFKPEQGE